MEGINLTEIGIVICSILCWVLKAKLFVNIMIALKERRVIYKRLGEKRKVDKFLDGKYNRLYRDTIGKDKVKIDISELFLILLVILNGLALSMIKTKILVNGTFILGAIIGIVCYIKSNKQIKELSIEKSIELDIFKLRIRFNKYVENLSTSEKHMLEKDFEDILKAFKNDSNKGNEFRNTTRRLEDLEIRLNRFLNIETLS